MGTHNSKYYVGNEIYHFETEGKSIVIYDDDKNAIGTLNDVFLKGKTVSGVDFKTLKTTGIYNVQGLKNIPSNIPTNTNAILAVTAIGSTSSPDVILYRIVGSNGAVSENTVSGGFESGWIDSGIGLKNQIAVINNSINQAIQGVNNNKDMINKTNNSLNDLNNRFNNHNHDNRYVLKSGDTIDGNLTIGKGRWLSATRDNNQVVTMLDVDQNDIAWLGDKNLDLEITSKNGLKVNGKKVFTEDNVGSGSGLDADKLDGMDSSMFALRNSDNDMYGNMKLHSGKGVIIDTNAGDNQGLYFWSDKNGYNDSAIKGTGDGQLNFETAGNRRMRLDYNGTLWNYGDQYFDVTDSTRVTFYKTLKGTLGFVAHPDAAMISVWNASTQQSIVDFGDGQGSNIMHIFAAPYIQGRRMFLQNDRPSGDIPYGSVWIGF